MKKSINPIKSLVMILVLTAISATISEAREYQLLKEATFNTTEYIDDDRPSATISKVILSESDSSLYVFADFYKKEVRDNIGLWSIPWLLKYNKDLELEWVQKDFFQYSKYDTIGTIITFEENENNSITLVISFKSSSPEEMAQQHIFLKKFEISEAGAITSSELLGDGTRTDETVIYEYATTIPYYDYGKPKKIGDSFYLKTRHNDSIIHYPAYGQMLKLTTNPFAIKKDSVWITDDAEALIDDFFPLNNGNILFLNRVHSSSKVPNRQFTNISDLSFNVATGSSVNFDSAYSIRHTQTFGNSIKAITFIPAEEDYRYDIKLHSFSKEDGAYQGLENKMLFPLFCTFSPTLELNQAGKMFGVVTASAKDEVPPRPTTFYFLHETSDGILDTLRLREVERTSDIQHCVQVGDSSYIAVGFAKVRYNWGGGEIWLAKIGVADTIADTTSVIEDNIVRRYLWVMNSYPNPADGFVKFDFYCTPRYINEMKIEIYDEMGRQFNIKSYEITNYDTHSGKGILNIDISDLPTGPKYIMLKVKGDSYTENVMVE